MLSYQHAYHAGNAADVHKHLALVMLLRRLQRKDTPFCFVDSHAGRGVYDLESAEAQKTGEAVRGIGRLACEPDAPAVVADYLTLIENFNAAGGMRCYPGSAALATAMLRPGDRAILLERHPQEAAALKAFFGKDRRVSLHMRDCYEGLPALLPPQIRRGLVLVDPSYETRTEYEEIAALVARAFTRWANGIFLVWYPLLAGVPHEQRLLRRLAAAIPTGLLVDEFRFAPTGIGLTGSGLALVNAPWQFDAELAAAMRFVARVLAPEVPGRTAQRQIG
jgi:23S rRNA (adenine2030-N6)-methyltransferase